MKPTAYPKAVKFKDEEGQRDRVHSTLIAAKTWMQAPVKSLGWLCPFTKAAASQLAGCTEVDLKYSGVLHRKISEKLEQDLA